MSRLYGDVFPGVFVQKLDCLERITQEVCSGLQVQNRQMQRFFRRFETDAIRDNLCLAKVMTLSFFLYDHPELEKEAEALKRYWAGMRQEGFQIVAVSMSGLEFRPLEPGAAPEGPGGAACASWITRQSTAWSCCGCSPTSTPVWTRWCS